ncbi:hypothetical protein AGR4C_Cc170134 [Agrobacterium tumefaciens str. Kerr 14]|uniref:Uncharacterized protein n=1 Tax=Agrobacterium tumefaciens str. Kerr 14 TaxID=1183424 RepID=A0A1S7PES8_AGRTU|nr:hypothetical protein AGR4C_Cc170134 [Agrobacterium tumefaciens str. Kerr 14]
MAHRTGNSRKGLTGLELQPIQKAPARNGAPSIPLEGLPTAKAEVKNGNHLGSHFHMACRISVKPWPELGGIVLLSIDA